MRSAIILQARMGSTRLPGKVLKKLAGKTILEIHIERLRKAKSVDDIIIATSVDDRDVVIEKEAGRFGLPCFRGSEHDVLSRYFHAASAFNIDLIVRITADCPLIEPGIIDMLVSEFRTNEFDYVSNIHPPTYPKGLDVEVFSKEALAKAYREAKLSPEREHVTPYIWKHENLFRLKNLSHSKDLSHHRWTIDTENDYIFINKIYENLYKEGELIKMQDVLEFLDEHPEIFKINQTQIQEGV